MTTIEVHAEHSYPVVVQRGCINNLSAHLGNADRVAIIHPQVLAQTAQALKTQLSGGQVVTIQIPDAEAAKSVSVLEFCWEALGQAGFTRNDVVVSLGGGATTDLAGFVAATWLRGIRVVHIPTTLLAMVDAGVGGKTGINTPSGKNLVGSFYSPAAVLCDIDFLHSQHERDYVAGLAEIIKAGFIRDQKILELIEADPVGARSPHWPHTEEIITRAIKVKADVVGNDLKELLGSNVGREILNYGHTFGHAIERAENYTWRHGDAVAVGMMYVAHLANCAGRLSSLDLERHKNLLSAVGLPTSYVGAEWEELLDAMRIDKKSRGNQLRFVILEGIAKPVILEGPDSALLLAAYQQVVNG
jgi:3-dehydroquinate synthase